MNRQHAHPDPARKFLAHEQVQPESKRRLVAETLAFLFVVAVVIAAMSLDYRP